MYRLLGFVLLAALSFRSTEAADPKGPPTAEQGIQPIGADGKPLNLDFETGTLKDWPSTTDVAVVPWTRNENAATAGLKTTLYADNAVALASFSDLVVQTALHGIPHNYTERLVNGGQGEVPAYMRRADDFMRAHAATPIRMQDVAAASGRSMRTREVGYTSFRDIPPPAALPAQRVMSADGRALRQRHQYGTILAGLEHRRVVNLLPDRRVETLSPPEARGFRTPETPGLVMIACPPYREGGSLVCLAGEAYRVRPKTVTKASRARPPPQRRLRPPDSP